MVHHDPCCLLLCQSLLRARIVIRPKNCRLEDPPDLQRILVCLFFTLGLVLDQPLSVESGMTHLCRVLRAFGVGSYVSHLVATIAFDKSVVPGTILFLLSSCSSRFVITWSIADTSLIVITRVIHPSIGPSSAGRETNIVGSLPALMFVAMPRDS